MLRTIATVLLCATIAVPAQAQWIDVQVTIDDPVMYTKPFSIRYALTLTPDTDIIESVCAENERDVAHLVGK